MTTIEKFRTLDAWSYEDCGCNQRHCLTCLAREGYDEAAAVIQTAYARCEALQQALARIGSESEDTP